MYYKAGIHLILTTIIKPFQYKLIFVIVYQKSPPVPHVAFPGLYILLVSEAEVSRNCKWRTRTACWPLRSLDAPGNMEIIHPPLFSVSHMTEILNVTQLLIHWFTHISKEYGYHWPKKTKETKKNVQNHKKSW